MFSQKDVILFIDGIKVNGLTLWQQFLKTYTIGQHNLSLTSPLTAIRRHYMMSSNSITRLDITSSKSDVTTNLSHYKIHETYKIEMNTSNPQKHVPEAKRNNQVIKK